MFPLVQIKDMKRAVHCPRLYTGGFLANSAAARSAHKVIVEALNPVPLEFLGPETDGRLWATDFLGGSLHGFII